ncbi:hypothetical protein AB0M28_02045 [Streptomyces sp. NPDC051940]|uniref:hypothetical protein n=1 Tax=Streptomyces sp. NPDC051940 TaxID=3155675 RepID=UPI0034375389
MATFHIGQQHAQQIQNAETINNTAGTAPAEDLAALIQELREELRRLADAGEIDEARAEGAGGELELAGAAVAEEDAPPGAVRAALARATAILSDVAAASAVVTALQAAAGRLPLG